MFSLVYKCRTTSSVLSDNEDKQYPSWCKLLKIPSEHTIWQKKDSYSICVDKLQLLLMSKQPHAHTQQCTFSRFPIIGTSSSCKPKIKICKPCESALIALPLEFSENYNFLHNFPAFLTFICEIVMSDHCMKEELVHKLY